MKWFDNEEFELTRREVEVDIRVLLHCDDQSLQKDIAETSELKGDGWEYKLHIAAVSESCAEEAGPKDVPFIAPARDRLGDSRLSSTSKTVDPQDGFVRGYVDLTLRLDEVVVILFQSLLMLDLEIDPAADRVEKLDPSGWRTVCSSIACVKSRPSSVM